MAAPTFASRRADYDRMWDAMIVTPSRTRAVDSVARKILAGMPRYREVEVETGVPAAVIGLLHNREAGCNFDGILHNGEKIIGKGVKTRLVPKGRGPFTSWKQAAIDAMAIKGYDRIKDWSVARVLFISENFNGWGYFNKGVPSPYLWAGSNQYIKGKYVRDHVYDPDVVDKQMGVAPVMLRLMALDPTITFSAAANDNAPADKYGVGTWNNTGLKAVQELLRAKGYAEVGTPDGDWGVKTENGLRAFQAANGLTVTARYDAATAAALPSAPHRVPSGARSEVTANDLKKAGAPDVKANATAGLAAKVIGIPTFLGAAVEGAASYFGDAAIYVQHIKDMVEGVPGMVWLAGIAALSFVIWWNSRKATQAKVAAVRSGEDAGPAGLSDVRTA